MECDTLGSTEAFGMCRGRARGSSCQKADLKDGDARVCALCQSLRIQLSCEKLIRGKEIEEGEKKDLISLSLFFLFFRPFTGTGTLPLCLLKREFNLELQAFYTGHMERTYLQGPNEIWTHTRRITLLGRTGGEGGGVIRLQPQLGSESHSLNTRARICSHHHRVALLFLHSRLVSCANLAAMR